MARLGHITLGGRTSGVSVAFDLSDPAPSSYLHVAPEGSWEVEVHLGEANIVARTPHPLPRREILAQGLEQAQRCLDILSFEKRQSLVVQQPGDNHIILFVRDGAYVVQHVGTSPLEIGMNANVVVTNAAGKVLPQETMPPVWTPALRYYRLSQANTDLYDAYRTLWLGFETLLDIIFPKRSNEREGKWLMRAISQAGATIDLKQFVPAGCDDPAAYIVDAQYKNIRCRLFHSKIAPAISRPDVPDPEDVISAYEHLVRLWREIAERCLSVRSGGGGAFTYAGFKMMLDNALTNRLKMFFTDDPSPIRIEDTEVSPTGRPIYPFSTVTYLSETSPGRTAWLRRSPHRNHSWP